jgi:hypothetical protein
MVSSMQIHAAVGRAVQNGTKRQQFLIMRVAPRVHAAAAFRARPFRLTLTAMVAIAIRQNPEWRAEGGKLLLAKAKPQ